MYITTELLLLLLNSSGCQRPDYDCVTKFSISGEASKLIATGSRQMLLIIKQKRDDLCGRCISAYQHGHCMPPWRMPQLNKRTAERLCQKTALTDGRQSCLGCVSKTSTNMGHVVAFGAAAPYPLFRVCRAASRNLSMFKHELTSQAALLLDPTHKAHMPPCSEPRDPPCPAQSHTSQCSLRFSRA